MISALLPIKLWIVIKVCGSFRLSQDIRQRRDVGQATPNNPGEA